MTTLDVFDGLDLPAEFVTQPCGILARRGAGKTYTALKLTEALVGAGLPVVVLDPLGVCWGLRSSADGKRPGLPVTILGGEHGDLPLEPTGGKVVAQFVVDHPGAYVLDLSSFEADAQQDRLALDFAATLYRAKNRDRTPLHLIVDEADSFAPQRPFPAQTKMLGAFEAIVRRGRSRGLGVTLVSQRPAVLNKNVLSQVEVLVALQVTAPQDRDALKDWATGFSTKDQLVEFLSGLARLEVGEAWVWSPQWLGVFARTRVKARATFDSSSTPKAGEAKVEPRSFADVDLDALKAEMADSIERSRENDPNLLREALRAAETDAAQLRRALDTRPAETVEVEQIVEVPALDPEVVEALDRLATQVGVLTDRAAELSGDVGQVAQVVEHTAKLVRVGLRSAAEQIAAFGVSPETATAARAPRRTRAVEQRQTAETAWTEHVEGLPIAPGRVDSDLTVGRDTPEVDAAYRPRAGARRMLEALARYPAGLTTAQVATHARVKKSGGTFGTYASELVRAGLVEVVSGSVKAGTMRVTDAGVAAVGGTPLPSDPAELRAEWRDRLKARGAKAMFDFLVAEYPAGIGRDVLARDAGLTLDGGTFGTYLSRLRANGLVEEDGNVVRAHPDLFLGDRR